MRDLVAFYHDRCCLFGKENNHWDLALENVYFDKSVDEAFLILLLEECQNPLINGPKEYLHYLRKLVSIGFFLQVEPEHPLLSLARKALKQIYTQGFWREFQLGEALYALGCHLLGLPLPLFHPKQLPKGGILSEVGNHLSDGGIPHPLMNTELALIWLFLSWEIENEELLSASLKWAHFAMGLFDHENYPFHGIWLRESEYRPLIFLSHYFLLFSVSSQMLLSPKIKHLADALFDKLEEMGKDSFQAPPYFLFLLACGFKRLSAKKNCLKPEGKFSSNEIDEDLGCFIAQHQDMSLICSFSGVNTGLGALHKTHVRIVSFGPHFSPLSDSDRYGLHRISSGIAKPFRDIEFEKEERGFELKGWSRLISPFVSDLFHHNMTLMQPGNQWVFFSVFSDGELLKFESRLSKHDETHPLFFAFFLIADQVVVEGGHSLVPATLDRYQGLSTPLTFKKEGEELRLYPQTQTKMDVIPLAGSPHFYSANFLIAFAFEKDQKNLVWTLT